MKIPLSEPDIGNREIEAVVNVLRSRRLSIGPQLENFENAFARYVGMKYAVGVSSGTAALHLCVKALGIGAGDDTITTSFTFVASANCLLYEGAIPVFADIDSQTLNIDPTAIRDVIQKDYVRDSLLKRWVHRRSRRTLKAILPVHIFGLPCDMKPIIEIAHDFDLGVIEDACEALGAEYAGQRVGTFGDAAVFGFYPNKQVTTAEGGIIVTNDDRLADICRSLRNQGRAKGDGWLLHTHLGYNYRLSELHCALGVVQLERIDELLSERARVARLYSEALADLPGVELPGEVPGAKRSWFSYVIQVLGPSPAARRNALMTGLHARGIDCRPYFPAIHRQPYFRSLNLGMNRTLPRTELAADRALALPFYPSMTREMVYEICSAVRDLLIPTSESASRGKEPCTITTAREALNDRGVGV
jgi:perosamine synthetase